MRDREKDRVEVVIVEGVQVELVRKDIKNLHLSVHPPAGRVRLSVPRLIRVETVLQILTGRLKWIRERQKWLLAGQGPAFNYVSGEVHLFRGEKLTLHFIPHAGKAKVQLGPSGSLDLFAKADSSPSAREQLIQNWYRGQLKLLVAPLLVLWQTRIGVKAAQWSVKKMKTKWGTCNVQTRRIWLSLELAKKSPPCLEYVVVHELVHLLERSHNSRFKAFMDRFLPNWRVSRSELNGTVRPGEANPD